MVDVVLLYAEHCPNVSEARAKLRSAFEAAGIAGSWREVDVDAADTPPGWKGLGSPTILVDGEDVVAGSLPGGPSCRVYADLARTPSVETIVEALARSRERSSPVRR